jgi:uncharacterized Fe-S cluster-containing MiaB family protein
MYKKLLLRRFWRIPTCKPPQIYLILQILDEQKQKDPRVLREIWRPSQRPNKNNNLANMLFIKLINKKYQRKYNRTANHHVMQKDQGPLSEPQNT